MEKIERIIALIILSLFLGGLSVNSGNAKSPSLQDLKKIEAEISNKEVLKKKVVNERGKLAVDLKKLEKKIVSSADKISKQEAYLDELDGELAALLQREKKLKVQYNYGTKNVSNLISQLMRLFATPSEIFLLKPEQMQNMQKDVAVIGGVLPLLTKKNQSVLSDLGDLKDLKIEITAHQEKLLKMTQKLAGDREELANLLAVKKQKYQMKETELSQITKSQEELAKSASDMKDLIEKLSRQQSKKLAKKTIKTKDKIVAKIKTILPVAGKIKIGYGEINELGAENKGVIISARPGAQVVAPYTGKVLFAGNFANYKELVIIAHKDGYHSVVAGMGKIIARVGSQVMQGEPIGVALDGADRSDVYYELRLNGSAIRPLL